MKRLAIKKFFLIALLAFFPIDFCFSQASGEAPTASEQEIQSALEMVKERNPERHKRLLKMRKNNPEKFNEIVKRRAKRQGRSQVDREEVKAIQSQIKENRKRGKSLLKEFFASNDQKRKENLEKQLDILIDEQFELRKRRREVRLKRLESRLAEFKDRHTKLASNKDSFIKEYKEKIFNKFKNQ